MRRRIVPVLALALLLAGAVDPLTSQADPVPAAPAAAGPRTVTLVTGDRVMVSTGANGAPSVTLAPGGSVTGRGFEVLASGPHLYVIPEAAAGYIGAPLDLSLFDVGTDTANYAQPGTANPATSSTADPATRGPVNDALPLKTTGSVPAGMAKTSTGQLVLQDPAAFGRALARDWTAANQGQPSGHLLDGVTPLQARPNPPGKLYTLTVRAYDRNGKRVSNQMGTVMNADDIDTFLAGQAFYNGEFAFSVPAGTYSLESYIATATAGGGVDWTLAAAPDIHVTRDTTVVLDARKAVRLTTNINQSQVIGQLNLQRNPTTGFTFTDSFTTFDNSALYATPTSPVDTGQLYFYPGVRLGDPQTDVYDMEFPSIGVIPSTLSYSFSADQFATVDERFHSSVPGRSELESRVLQMPWQAEPVWAATNVVAPDTRTDHVLALPEMRSLQQVTLDNADSLATASDAIRTLEPGQHTSTDWAAQPMAPGIQQDVAAAQACPACRAGDTLNLTLFGTADASGHIVLPDASSTESLTLFQDGQQVGQAPAGFAAFPLSASPASYQLVYDTSRDAAWWPTSTHTHTTWSFTDAERPPDQLPTGWTCSVKGGGGGGGRGGSAAPAPDGGCSFEPLLFTRYSTGAGTDDVVPAGQPANVEVDVAHQLGAPATPITSFSAQVSYDDGSTWTDVPATQLADGRYRLNYSQPVLNATDGFASLHITAADANGSAVEQTITRAYPLAVTAPVAVQPPAGQPGAPAQQHACGDAAPPYLQCMAIVNAAAGVTDTPNGLSPADIQAAYAVHSAAARTIAIVDAYDDPNAESDLADYRAQYGLTPCTTANGCFRKIDQRGGTDYPDPDAGWGLEISLDLDAVSATCPACHIVLIEADSANGGDLLTGVLTADAQHVDAISNSYGSRGEFSGEQTLEHYYHDLRAPALFATGDYGYGNGAILVGSVSYPSASRYTVAVGGTSLTPASNGRGWTETAWDGATSGCSAYIHKPGWQRDQLCDMRSVADVSAVADPKTGLAVRDTFGYAGWLQVGGTSLATPIVASLYGGKLQDLYRDPSAVFDVVGGSNGTNCSNTYLCNAVAGYDGPTGLGTPNAADPFWSSH